MDDLKPCGDSEKEAERLTNTIRIFLKDIATEFGISKCSNIKTKAGELVSVGGMELSSREVIPELESDKGYKYFGILEIDDIMHIKMKDKIKKEYYRRVRQLTSLKLNGGNTIREINSQAVSLVRYSAGILKGTKDELKAMDRKTQKIMMMNRIYHPQSDTDRLYIPRIKGGRGLLSIADCVETEEQNLSLYLDQSEERLLRFSKSERILPQYGGPVSTTKKQKKEQRHKQWKEKQLHGKFTRETEEIRSEETWGWIRKCYLKKETEVLIFAAQEQTLRTSWIRKNIDGWKVSEKCRICEERVESMTHLIAGSKKLAQKEYRHDNIARIVHLELCQKFGLIGEVKWYNHKHASVAENDRVKILWDFKIQTDHVIQHRNPDIVVLYKNERKCHLIDMVVPGDKRIELKEQEKIDNYTELRQEVKKIWNLSQVVVVPVVTGALGVTSKRFGRLAGEVKHK